MKINKISIEELKKALAPCGMYCGFCGSYLAKLNIVPKRPYIVSHCDGCRVRDKKCAFLKRDCPQLLNHEIEFCYECETFPCANLEKLDKSYRTKYQLPYSFIKFQKSAKNIGIENALLEQISEFFCETCGSVLCIHNRLCYNCDKEVLASMKNYYNT